MTQRKYYKIPVGTVEKLLELLEPGANAEQIAASANTAHALLTAGVARIHWEGAEQSAKRDLLAWADEVGHGRRRVSIPTAYQGS